MNEYLFEELLSTPPKISSLTVHQEKDLEGLYKACLILDKDIGEIEVSDDATIGHIYELLLKKIKSHNVEVTLDKTEMPKQTDIEFHYNIDTDIIFIEVENLLEIKSKNRLEYWVVLRCITLLSHYCTNNFYFNEYYKEIFEERCENIEHEGLSEEDEEWERAITEEAIIFIEEQIPLEKDLIKLCKATEKRNILYLKNILNNRILRDSLSPEAKKIAVLVIDNFIKFKIFDCSDRFDNNISHTRLYGFTWSFNNDLYNQIVDDSFQMYWDNCDINFHYKFINYEVEKRHIVIDTNDTYVSIINLFDNYFLNGGNGGN